MCLNKRSCLIPFALATQCDSNDGVTQCGVSILAKERESGCCRQRCVRLSDFGSKKLIALGVFNLSTFCSRNFEDTGNDCCCFSISIISLSLSLSLYLSIYLCPYFSLCTFCLAFCMRELQTW